jgi:UDPglucose 6-dehydrogenase
MNVVIIGTGYVGLVTGACLAEMGAKVVCVDSDKAKIDLLRAGEIPIFEPGLKEIVTANVEKDQLSFEVGLSASAPSADIVFIAVGTPTDQVTGDIDTSYVKDAVSELATLLDGYTVIVSKSTVPIGTGDQISSVIESFSGGADFDVVSNPEFLREGSAVFDFMNPSRIVLGVESSRAENLLRELYDPLCPAAPVLVMDIKSAELTKYAANAFLATKVSFINEIAALCDSVGADVECVAHGMGLDDRIGPRFLKPGPGVGGSCFPKDTRALVNIAKDHGVEARIVTAVIEVNRRQKTRMVKKVEFALGGRMDGKRVGVLGLTFKPNTDDMREAPSLAILSALADAGVQVKAHDPEGMDEARPLLPKSIIYCSDMYDVFDDADAVVVITEWDIYKHLDFSRAKGRMRTRTLIDMRNVYRRDTIESLGFQYFGVGR